MPKKPTQDLRVIGKKLQIHVRTKFPNQPKNKHVRFLLGSRIKQPIDTITLQNTQEDMQSQLDKINKIKS